MNRVYRLCGLLAVDGVLVNAPCAFSRWDGCIYVLKTRASKRHYYTEWKNVRGCWDVFYIHQNIMRKVDWKRWKPHVKYRLLTRRFAVVTYEYTSIFRTSTVYCILALSDEIIVMKMCHPLSDARYAVIARCFYNVLKCIGYIVKFLPSFIRTLACRVDSWRGYGHAGKNGQLLCN